jgi:nucleoside-diphosphate-sugar epimerase
MLVGITGGSGFVGSLLARRHAEAGDAVRCLTRQPQVTVGPGVRMMPGDLCVADERLTRFADGLDVLYHCAGEVRDEARMRAVNVEGTRALVRAAAGRIGRWVQLSSVGVYGGLRTGVVCEEAPLDPRSTYEITKAESDRLVIGARDASRIASLVVLRPSIVFGSGMPNRSLWQLIRAIERGLFFFVGRRGASANYVHVSNVVDALRLCGTSAAAEARVYNLSDWCTMEDFAGAIADALGRPRPRMRFPEWPVRRAVRIASRFGALPLTESRLDALVTRARYSMERIQRELKYVAAVSIPDGLAQMVAPGTSS